MNGKLILTLIISALIIVAMAGFLLSFFCEIPKDVKQSGFLLNIGIWFVIIGIIISFIGVGFLYFNR